jgi:hypothetical protein
MRRFGERRRRRNLDKPRSKDIIFMILNRSDRAA